MEETESLSLTWGSLILLLIFTAIGTVFGGIFYYYVQAILPSPSSNTVQPTVIPSSTTAKAGAA